MPPLVPSGIRLPGPQRRMRRRVVRLREARACKACGGPFRSRSRTHIYCARKLCRRKRRLEYMRRYMQEWKKAHPDYWKTDKQRQYLKRWREEHPDYFRNYLAKWRKKNTSGASRTRARPKAQRAKT